ncbi:MAG: STAS domain-containing protein, partial [Phycisphaeraceae bacterium]|nr:STAS domain-containing protein [Phycisphaeraceae bacterium]
GGLAALVGTQRRMKKYEGRLQLSGLSDRVKDVFALMQLTDLFEIHATVDEAFTA